MGDGPSGTVLLPTTIKAPDVGRETGTLFTVMTPPGVRVLLPPTISADPEVSYAIGVLATVTIPLRGFPGPSGIPNKLVSGTLGTDLSPANGIVLPPRIPFGFAESCPELGCPWLGECKGFPGLLIVSGVAELGSDGGVITVVTTWVLAGVLPGAPAAMLFAAVPPILSGSSVLEVIAATARVDVVELGKRADSDRCAGSGLPCTGF